MTQYEKFLVIVFAVPLVLFSCATPEDSKLSPQAAKNENPILYFVNSKATSVTEYQAFIEKLNSEKIDLGHEETTSGESTFYRLKDARGYLYQVSEIRESHRITMSVNVLSAQ